MIIGKYNIGFGHMGNGIIVWDRNRKKHGDYMNIAHIDLERKVKYYDKALSEEVKSYIQNIADTSTVTASATQDIPVFLIPSKR